MGIMSKKITTEDLARMVNKGFEHVLSEMGGLTKKIDVDHRFDEVDRRFDEVERRFDRIEKLILADHKRRIERLEIEVKDLKDLLAVK